MSSKFQPINCDTPYLLPPSVRDWLPEKHLARFVVEIVGPLDLNPLLTRYHCCPINFHENTRAA